MKNQKGVSMVTLVITIVVILILAGIAFIGSLKTIEKTNYSKYVSNVSDVSSAFGESAAIVKGKKIMEDKKKEMEQIHNYLAKNGAEEKDFLKVDDVPQYTIIRNEGQLGIELPDMEVESGTGKKVHVKYAATSQGKIFTWPPLEHEDKLYITDKDTVEHKMQTLIKVGDEEFRIKIDSGDGSLLDWLIETSNDDGDERPERPSGDDSPLGHQHVFTSQTQTDEYFCSDVTCVLPKKYYYKCISCDAKGTTTYTVGTALGHAFAGETLIKEANCTEKGVIQSKCTRCGTFANFDRPINSANHHGGERVEIIKKATCVETGSKTIMCASCNTVLRTERIDTTDHDMNKVIITKQATCTEKGIKTFKCSGCDKEMKTEEIDALGHGDERVEILQNATCTEKGRKAYKCSICNVQMRTEEIEATGHSYGSFQVTKEATCEEEGVMTQKCSRCGDEITEKIPKDTSKHCGTEETKTVDEATCLDEGTVEIICSACKAVLQTQTVAALGHDWNSPTLPRKCNRCGLEETKSCTYDVVYQSTSGLYLGSTTVAKDLGTTNTIVAPEITGYNTPESQDVTWDSETKTITFTYTPISYSVTIDCNGGSGVTGTTYTIETETFTLGTPTMTRYTFVGWTGSNGTTPETTVSIDKGSIGDRSYIANWKGINYTYNVIYKSESGIELGGTAETKEFGTTNTIVAPEIIGYDTPASQDVTWDSEIKIITFTYTPTSYSITIDCNGGSGVTSTSYTIETETFTLGIPTRSEYIFAGWTGSNGTTAQTTVTITKGSIGERNYTANWIAKEYTYDVIYQSTSGINLGSSTVTKEYGTTNTVVAPEIVGYDTPASQDVTWDSATAKTITFIYTPISYSITIDCNGGSGVTSTSYTIETETFALEAPIRDGYSFTGWTGSNGDVPEILVIILNGGTGALNYTANWSVDQFAYDVVYQSTSGLNLGSSTIIQTYGTISTIIPPEIMGYNTPASQDVTWDSTTAKTITFIYTPTSYSVTIDCNGGSGVTSTSYTIETETFTLGTPTREGYVFTGWTGSNGNEPETSVSIVKGSVGALSYTANWEAINSITDVGEVGDYVLYSDNQGVNLWRIFDIKDGIVYIIPADGPVGSVTLGYFDGYINAIPRIEATCDEYISDELQIGTDAVRSMKEEDIYRVIGYTQPATTLKTAWYADYPGSGTVTYNGVAWTRYRSASSHKFYEWDYAAYTATDEDGNTYAYPSGSNPVYLTIVTIPSCDISSYDHVVNPSIKVASLFSSTAGWIASKTMSEGDGWAANFYLKDVNSTAITRLYTVDSAGDGGERTRGVLPMVSLDSNIKEDRTGDGTREKPWVLYRD